MVQENSVTELFKKNLKLIIYITGFVTFILIFPAVVIRSSKGWQNFGAWSTYAYTILTFATLVGIFLAAYSALQQLIEITRSRRLALIDVVFELSRYYATDEMHKAIITVWHSSPEEINQDWEKRNQRRMVSEFWTTIAWAVKDGLVELDFFYSRFGSNALNIWDQRLRELELEVRIPIERNNPDNIGKSEEEIRRLAEYHVDREQPLAWLSREWKRKSVPERDKTPK